ncbi:MAG: acyl-ACP--UDP-N-acetylglucosamine O-acyltransferase [Victivallaceae bacterium]|nr:acyl-ACP--UDP-N-acetylglucosamine O-acyltransferase [Victivallaceae bacterium]
MAKIHPTSVVCEGAVLDDSVEVGPLCYIGPHVKIGPKCRLVAHCCVDGSTTLGANNILFPFASLGQMGQDHAATYGDETYLNIGDCNEFREGCVINTGSKHGSETRIGNHCMFMNGSHAGHNCSIGDNVIVAGNSVLAGYVKVFDSAFISGCVAVHQFCRVGRLAIISGVSAFSMDIPPFVMAEGRNGGVKMLNLVGLKRAGIEGEALDALKDMFRIYFRSGMLQTKALEKIKTDVKQTEEVREFVTFCETSERGVMGPPRGNRRG